MKKINSKNASAQKRMGYHRDKLNCKMVEHRSKAAVAYQLKFSVFLRGFASRGIR